MESIKKYYPGILLSVLIALLSYYISSFIPNSLISAGVFALLLGMSINPAVTKYNTFKVGMNFVFKKVLKIAIILMGTTLSFSQVFRSRKILFNCNDIYTINSFWWRLLSRKVVWNELEVI